MHDIVGTMFNKRFMEELFKPQDTYSKKAMRTVFDRLAHASIMRLNSASMDKVKPHLIFRHSLKFLANFICKICLHILPCMQKQSRSYQVFYGNHFSAVLTSYCLIMIGIHTCFLEFGFHFTQYSQLLSFCRHFLKFYGSMVVRLL